jgi:hypothetical protein
MDGMLGVEWLLGGRRDGGSGSWMLTRIWIAALYVTLIMPMLALRRLLVLRVLHHLCGSSLKISFWGDVDLPDSRIWGRVARRQRGLCS